MDLSEFMNVEPQNVKKTIYINKHLYEKIEQRCLEKEIPFHELIDDCIRYALDRIYPKDD
jgi:hypothetical protein